MAKSTTKSRNCDLQMIEEIINEYRNRHFQDGLHIKHYDSSEVIGENIYNRHEEKEHFQRYGL